MSVTDFFGKVVSKNYKKHPVFTRNFIKTGYALQNMLLKYKPDPRFSPSQDLLVRASMKYTRLPLKHPKKSALVNLFTPCEILHAMDIYPQCAEGYSSYLTGGKSERPFIDESVICGMADSMCSYHKAMTGAAKTGVMAKPKYIITTSSVCDANMNSFRKIAEIFNMPEFFIDVPETADDYAVEYVEKQIMRLVEFLEDGEKKKLSKEKLLKAINNSNQSVLCHKQFLKELETKDFPTSITLEMFKIFATHILLGTEESKEYFRLQVSEIKERSEKTRKRILWSHVLPYYMEDIKNWLDFSDSYQLLPPDMVYDALMPLDAEKPFASMAKRLILNHFNAQGERKIQNNIDMAKRMSADAGVIFCHWGCKQSNGSAYLLKDVLSSMGLKTLVLDGDACDRRNSPTGQIKTRIEAFCEMLEATL